MFNLLDEQWIPVLYADGRFDRVGIRTALNEAGKIRQIAASNPMDRVALLRFLLATLYWCRDNPPAQQVKDQLVATGHFPAGWFDNLEEQRACFNLLGTGQRFYQDGAAARERAATDLLQEIPTGNNFWHFRHSTDRREGLCLACCALGLLRLPLFSVSGLPNLKAGINGTPPIYVLQIGHSLLETLCFNWLPHSSVGVPAWEPVRAGNNARPVSLLAGLTMLSRRVLLHAPCPPSGACIACGSEQAALVRTCGFESAGDQSDDGWQDPHVVYIQKTNAKEGTASRKSLTAPDLTKASFRLDKPWVPLVIQVASTPRRSAAILAVGFATDKAKNIDVWERSGRVPFAPATATALLDRWQDEFGKLPFRMKCDGRKSRGVGLTAAVAAVRPHVEARVSARVTELLATPEHSWPSAVDEYRRMVPLIAGALAPGFTTRAVMRRNDIDQVLPDLSPRPVAKSRKKAKKEGGA